MCVCVCVCVRVCVCVLPMSIVINHSVTCNKDLALNTCVQSRHVFPSEARPPISVVLIQYTYAQVPSAANTSTCNVYTLCVQQPHCSYAHSLTLSSTSAKIYGSSLYTGYSHNTVAMHTFLLLTTQHARSLEAQSDC